MKDSCIISNITDFLSVEKKIIYLALQGLLFSMAIDLYLFLLDVYYFTTAKRIAPCPLSVSITLIRLY